MMRSVCITVLQNQSFTIDSGQSYEEWRITKIIFYHIICKIIWREKGYAKSQSAKYKPFLANGRWRRMLTFIYSDQLLDIIVANCRPDGRYIIITSHIKKKIALVKVHTNWNNNLIMKKPWKAKQSLFQLRLIFLKLRI